MARKRAFDEAAVLRAARDVFWVRGYEAASLDLLQAAMGLSRSSLYVTFGSKRALFTRVLSVYLAEVINPRLAPLEQEAPGSQLCCAISRTSLAICVRRRRNWPIGAACW